MYGYSIAVERKLYAQEDRKLLKSDLNQSLFTHHYVHALKGVGYVLASSNTDAPYMLESIWTQLDCPEYMLVVEKSESNTYYFGIVFSKTPIFELFIDGGELQLEDNPARDELMYHLDGFSKLSSSEKIVVISDVFEFASNEMVFVDDLTIACSTSNIYHSKYSDLDDAKRVFPQETRKVRVKELIPNKTRRYIVAASSVLVAMWGGVQMIPKEEPPPPPPKIVDTWKSFRNVLEDKGVNVRMRALTFYGDIKTINQELGGYAVKDIVAKGNSTSIGLQKYSGSNKELFDFAEKYGYYVNINNQDVRLESVVETMPVMHEAVRADIRAEEVHLSRFVEDYYPESVTLQFMKPVSQGVWTEKTVKVGFSQFTLFDIDTLGIMFNPHPYAFESFKATVDDAGYLTGELNVILYGVTN